MNGLQAFSYNQTDVRMIMQEDGPWWVLADVCKVLNLGSPHKVADRLDEDEKGRNQIPTSGGPQEMTIINESGLYSVILRSDKPEARAFKRWITHEVLPTIRRTGGYHTPISEAELLLRLAQANLAQEQRISALERRVDSLTQPAASSFALYKPLRSTFEEASMDTDGFMDSMEVARILGREHNNVLKSIRTVSERARADGILTDDCISPVYRRCGNNVRHRYYRLNEKGISLLCQSLQDWTLAEKLRSTFKEKQVRQNAPGGDV